MGDTAISWTNKTWNPVTGCSKVSEGCDFCYAETLSLRRGWSAQPWTRENAAVNVKLRPERLREPLRWKEPVRVFVNSMSDLFHEAVPDEYVAEVFDIMRSTPQHTYQVLTKRPGRMASFTRAYYGTAGQPAENIWLGTSVETQRWADVRIPKLLEAVAAVRFLSCEPLLGRVDLRPYLWEATRLTLSVTRHGFPSVRGTMRGKRATRKLGWVIVGGESGAHLRGAGPEHPRWMKMEWAREIRDACVEAGVPFFFKQDSGPVTELRPWVVEEDGSRWEWHQYPGDLRPPVRLR